jgi:hypothetical protein
MLIYIYIYIYIYICGLEIYSIQNERQEHFLTCPADWEILLSFYIRRPHKIILQTLRLKNLKMSDSVQSNIHIYYYYCVSV